MIKGVRHYVLVRKLSCQKLCPRIAAVRPVRRLARDAGESLKRPLQRYAGGDSKDTPSHMEALRLKPGAMGKDNDGTLIRRTMLPGITS